MKRSKNGKFFVSVALLSAAYGASASDLYVIGQVDRISSNSIAVLGQTLKVENASLASSLTLGQFVIVDVEWTGNDQLKAISVQRFRVPYIPGASDVALTGIISKLDAARGYLTINGLSVYVVDAANWSSVDFSIGQQVEISGRQPVPGGVLLATQILKKDTAGVGVFRDASIAKLGAIDTVVGPGIDGRSTNAIVGTGAVARATAELSRTTDAIVGTGVTTQAITGTGRSTDAIVGTGITTQAITGTGRSKNAIIGTGR